MDPNATLAEIRKGIADLAGDVDNTEHPNYEDLLEMSVQSLAENFEALDEWLQKGGFLPSDWAKGRLSSRRIPQGRGRA
jgi:hypothetical protein